MAIELRIDASELRRLRVELDRPHLEMWLGRVVLEAQNVIQQETRKGGRGRVYVRSRHGKRIVHRASRPGDYPAVDTGRLTTGTRIGVEWPQGYIGSNVPYAKFLQFGTSKMAPRKLYREAIIDALKRMHGPDIVARFKTV